MAIYLTCTQKRGQQKKHIDVCHHCDLNLKCSAYQEFKQTESATGNTESSVSDQRRLTKGHLLKQVVADLREIKILLDTGGDGTETDRVKTSDASVAQEVTIDYLQKELRKIMTA